MNTKQNKNNMNMNKKKGKEKPKKRITIKKVIFIILYTVLICFLTYKASYYVFTKGNPISQMTSEKATISYLKEKYNDYTFTLQQSQYLMANNTFDLVLVAEKGEEKFNVGVNTKNSKVVSENFNEQKLSNYVSNQIKVFVAQKNKETPIKDVLVFFNGDTSKITADNFKGSKIPMTLIFKMNRTDTTEDIMSNDAIQLNKIIKENEYFENVEGIIYSYINEQSKKNYDVMIAKKDIDISAEQIKAQNLIITTNLDGTSN